MIVKNIFIGFNGLLFALIVPLASAKGLVNEDASGPVIEVWYEDELGFGQAGDPQKWVNILGNVSDPTGVKSLFYKLNDNTAKSLSIGPDNRRLQGDGDFNIDIDIADLLIGTNTLIISATNNNDVLTTKNVSFEYAPGQLLSSNLKVKWTEVTSLNDVVQVVDGKWSKQQEGIRTAEPGYDRIIAVGNQSWEDYEILVPVTIHNLAPPIGPFSTGFGLGILLRWQGHTDNPVSGFQPKAGWFPQGETAWISWTGDQNVSRLTFTNNKNVQFFTPTMGETYMFRVRVETMDGVGNLYSLKVWNRNGTEPIEWMITSLEGFDDLANGSILLIAHHVDLTFGDITVTNLNKDEVPVPLFSSSQDSGNPFNISFDASESSDPDGGIVSYNWDFGDGSEGSGITASHTYASTGVYNVALTVTDDDGNEITIIDNVFISNEATQNIVSDDFNTLRIDTNVWKVIDPMEDGSFSLSGFNSGDALLSISVPEGVEHDAWTGGLMVPRLMQPIQDTDFQIEAKFVSDMNSRFQFQGLVIEESVNKFLRYEFHHNGSDVVNFGATINNGFPDIRVSQPVVINPSTLYYLRISRIGDNWTLSYSLNGSNWTIATSFDFPLNPSLAGVFAGNADDNPAHTAIVDYFLNREDPFIPSEDAFNQPPKASFEHSASDDNTLLLDFDATTSEDPEDGALVYQWDFGDGSTALGEAKVQHIFAGPGPYNVQLKVTDDRGQTDMVTNTVIVETPNTPPQAIFSYTIDEVDLLTVHFDGTASNDPDGSIISYSWNFGENHTGSTAVASNTFTGAGTYHVSLTVIDNKGGDNTVSKDIVLVLPNESPVSAFDYQIDGENPLLVNFDASNSSDPEGDIVSYDWDFGDGTSGNNVQAQHTYMNGGEYQVQLTVTDDKGAMNSSSQLISIPTVTGLEGPTQGGGGLIRYQTFPNPFHRNVNFGFFLKKGGDVTIEIYDMQGRPVKRLDKKGLRAGEHMLEWSPQGLKNGIYFGRLWLNVNGKSHVGDPVKIIYSR